MKIRLSILISVITLMFPSLFAQNNENDELESHNRKIKTILNQYDDFYHFGKDLFKVKEKNLWGIINDKGEIILPIQYLKIEFIGPYRSYYDFIKMPEKYYFIETPDNRNGLINQEGKVLIDPNSYNRLFLLVHEIKSGGEAGNILLSVESNGKWGVISADGKFIIPPIYDFIGSIYDSYCSRDREDICLVYQNGRQGIISPTGETIVAPDKFERIVNVYGDFVEVCLEGGYGIIDLKGNIVLSPRYDNIELKDGFAIFSKMDNNNRAHYGIMNLKNKFNSELKYDAFDILEDGYIRVETRNMKQNGPKVFKGIIDSNGKSIFPLQYAHIEYLGNNLFEIRKEWNGNNKIVNQAGTPILSRPYDYARVKDGQLLIRRGETYKSIDPASGKEKIVDEYTFYGNDSFSNDNEKLLSDGMVLIWNNSKCGIKDVNGNELIPCKYDWIGDFNEEGLANACLNGKYGLIDKNDNVIIPFLFTDWVYPEDDVVHDDYGEFLKFTYFDEGLAKKEVRRNSEGYVIKFELVSYGNSHSDKDRLSKIKLNTRNFLKVKKLI